MGTEFDRRSLFKVGTTVAGAGALTAAGMGLTSPSAASASPVRNPNARPKMVLGTQRRASTVAMLQEFRRHGVERVWGYPPDPPLESGRGYWLPSEVAQTKEFIESEPGLEMHAATLPFLGSSLIDREDRPAIMLGKGPERDRDIDDIHKCLEACAAAGVGLVKYNMSLTGVISTGEVELRGGSTTRQFRAADLDPSLPDTIAGKVSADDFWERIDYFLERVVPVAEELKVRIACHPQDPGTPPGGYRGVEENVLSTPGGKGLFKFLSMHRSPYHGLNLCVGTLAEMLWNPPSEIYDIVRRLARTERVFNIHLRNIVGNRNDFIEVWPDEGDVDHARIINVLADEGYAEVVDPDHVPDHVDDPVSKQAYAHGYGFILGLVRGAEHRSRGRS
jgi:mannonate dehydratase